ncbi:MAG: ribbon-helix-helix domain-containing protein [Allorhizobium sp.]
MNVKTTVTLSEDHLRYAEKLVADGRYPSISSVIEAGLDQMSASEPESDPVAGMADEIRRRMELPRDQWIPWDGNEVMQSILARLAARNKQDDQ